MHAYGCNLIINKNKPVAHGSGHSTCFRKIRTHKREQYKLKQVEDNGEREMQQLPRTVKGQSYKSDTMHHRHSRSVRLHYRCKPSRTPLKGESEKPSPYKKASRQVAASMLWLSYFSQSVSLLSFSAANIRTF